MAEVREFPITGVIPPSLAEAKIREAWPSVTSFPAIANLGLLLTRTYVLAPLAWLIMSLVFFGKLMPIVMRRYTITNRRVMVRKGWSGTPGTEVPLAEIDDVRVVRDSYSEFFRAGTLEIIHGGQVVLTLRGVPEADGFRVAILNCRNAWVPGKSKLLPFIPASATK